MTSTTSVSVALARQAGNEQQHSVYFVSKNLVEGRSPVKFCGESNSRLKNSCKETLVLHPNRDGNEAALGQVTLTLFPSLLLIFFPIPNLNPIEV